MSHDQIQIIVNTEPKTVPHGKITYAQVVQLAFPQFAGNPDYIFTVQYRRGQGHSAPQSLAEGQDVQVQEGMIFNVAYSNRS